MSGEGQFKEQAKKQWEKLDAEGCKIINDLLVADKDRRVWPEHTELKFTGRKGEKLIKVAFNTKSKKYKHIYQEKDEVPAKEAIRLHIPNAHIYFCFHPTKNEYIMIDAPNRWQPNAKYIITAPFFHWIRERNITVSALLLYAIRITHTARSNIQKVIKNAPSEEALQNKIVEQKVYIELVEIILNVITALSDTCELNKDHETYVEIINSIIKFMCESGMKLGCKTLTRETEYTDFIYTKGDAETINSARDIVNSKTKGDKLVKQWRLKHDREVRAKNKAKQREIWEKWWENTSHHTENQKIQKQAQLSPWATTLWEHQHTQKNHESPSTNPMYRKLLQYQEP